MNYRPLTTAATLFAAALSVAGTFSSLAAPYSIESFKTPLKGPSTGGGVLQSFTVAPSANFYIGGYHYLNSNGLLASQTYYDVTTGQYSGGGWASGPTLSSGVFASNLVGNDCTDTALQGGTTLRAIGNYFNGPYVPASSPVPNPDLEGQIYLGSGTFSWTNIDTSGIVGDQCVGDPFSSTLFIQTDGGNSPSSTGFRAYGATNWTIPVSESNAAPAPVDQYYHAMAVVKGSDGVPYLYYCSNSGTIYAVNPTGGGTIVSEASDSNADQAHPALCSSGSSSDHTLYMAYVAGGNIYGDVFTVGTGGALTSVATHVNLVPTSGHLAGLSASSQGMFVDSFSSGSLVVGWLTPGGAPLQIGNPQLNPPGQTIDSGLDATNGYVDGIKAFGGSTPVVFASSSYGSTFENKFYAITASSTSQSLSVTTYTDTSHPENVRTNNGIVDASTNGSGYAIGRAYLTFGPARSYAYLKVTFIQYQ